MYNALLQSKAYNTDELMGVLNLISHSKPWITDEDVKCVESVMYSGMIAEGEKVREFESKLSSYFDYNPVLVCNSGTAALVNALILLDIEADDEIILPSYVCHSVVDAVLSVGAIPVICDVDENWVMTKETVVPHISKKTKAIIIVHIFGIAANIEDFKEFGITLIEDCCQSFGAKYDNVMVGSKGDMSILSFHATKCLTTGEGGALVINNSKYSSKLNSCKMQQHYRSMTDMQAALGLSQLTRYDKFLTARKKISEIYLNYFPSEFTKKIRSLSERTIFFRFPLYIKDYDINKIQNELYRNQIIARKGVDELIHRRLSISDDLYPNAVNHYNRTLSIPIYPSLEENEIECIVSVFKKLGKGINV